MIFGGNEKKRKPFGIRTKRIEWLKATGERGKKPLLQYLADGKIPKLSTSQFAAAIIENMA